MIKTKYIISNALHIGKAHVTHSNALLSNFFLSLIGSYNIFIAMILLFGLVELSHAKDKLELPNTDLYLFKLDTQQGKLVLGNGRNITQHKGYDNQPFFTSGGHSILFSSQRDPYQTDIYEYFLQSGQTKQLTKTEEQEYTPKSSPDNQIVTFVREGGDPKQSLWSMQRNTSLVSWSLKSLEPVGYYGWDHDTGYILLWLRYAFSLQLVSPEKGISEFVMGNIPPSAPHTIPGTHEFSFIHLQMNQEMWIKKLNPLTRAITPLIPVIGNAKDYTWLPTGSILMANQEKLYYWPATSQKGWQLIKDLTEHKISNITRLSVSPDATWLVLVANEPN